VARWLPVITPFAWPFADRPGEPLDGPATELATGLDG
jgi:hypothetical protein